MPCFYCGKRVSLVRQMTDSDFCSDEHRRRYHLLAKSALSRLLDERPPAARTETAAAPPAPAEAPAAPRRTREATPVRRIAPPEPPHKKREPEPEVVAPPPARRAPERPYSPPPPPERPVVVTARVEVQETWEPEPEPPAPPMPELPPLDFISEEANPAGWDYAARATPEGGSGLHSEGPCASALHTPAARDGSRNWMLPPAGLRDERPRVMSMPPAAWMVTEAGRSVPRPALPRVHVSSGLLPGLPQGELRKLARGAADREFPPRFISAFLAFRRQGLRPGLNLPASGLAPVGEFSSTDSTEFAAAPPYVLAPQAVARALVRCAPLTLPRTAASAILPEWRAAADVRRGLPPAGLEPFGRPAVHTIAAMRRLEMPSVAAAPLSLPAFAVSNRTCAIRSNGTRLAYTPVAARLAAHAGFAEVPLGATALAKPAGTALARCRAALEEGAPNPIAFTAIRNRAAFRHSVGPLACAGIQEIHIPQFPAGAAELADMPQTPLFDMSQPCPAMDLPAPVARTMRSEPRLFAGTAAFAIGTAPVLPAPGGTGPAEHRLASPAMSDLATPRPFAAGAALRYEAAPPLSAGTLPPAAPAPLRASLQMPSGAILETAAGSAHAPAPEWRTFPWIGPDARTVLPGPTRLLSAHAALPAGTMMTWGRGPAPVKPQSGAHEGWERPFAANELIFPPVPAVATPASLGAQPGATLPPKVLSGPPPESRWIDFAFEEHGAYFPDPARVEAVSAPSHLIPEPSFEAAFPGLPRDSKAGRAVRQQVFDIRLTSALVLADGVAPVAPLALSVSGFEPSPGVSPQRIEPRRRAFDALRFGTQEAGRPHSREIAAGHVLEPCGGSPVAAQPVRSAARPATAAVALLSTHANELIEAPAAGGGHALMTAGGSQVDQAPARLAPSPAASEWREFPAAPPRFDTIGQRVSGANWPGPDDSSFVPGPQARRHTGSASMDGPHGARAFEVPVACCPALPEQSTLLGHAAAAKLPQPAMRDDSRTGGRKTRLAPSFRLSSRPRRLPVLHATIGKAHMPDGAFTWLEREDCDDERTAALAGPDEAPPMAFVYPDARTVLRSRAALSESGPADTSGNGAPGHAALEPPFGELPYPFEPYFVETGLPLLGMDFEAIMEAFEPRWRSALKTASGLFRGVLMFIPGVIVMSALLTGCSGGSLHRSVQNRAAVHLEHDFSKGLDGWYGGREWARNWKRDQAAGFVRAGQLALYRPSQTCTDYSLEFFGQIAGDAIGWVYRASDLQNYYATKLVVVKPGPLPVMALVRYQVFGGQQTLPVQVPIRKILHNGRPYRISQQVAGSGFTTAIEGEVVDFWSDDRLRAGGVGFFADEGDAPHLYWMKVTYQDDFWGKLCAILAPNN